MHYEKLQLAAILAASVKAEAPSPRTLGLWIKWAALCLASVHHFNVFSVLQYEYSLLSTHREQVLISYH